MKNEEKNTIGSRIHKLIFSLDKNQSSFADAIGFSQPSVHSTIKDKTIPKRDFIDAIIKAFPNVNRDWLEYGKGEMLVDSSLKIEEPVKTEPVNDSGYLLEALKRIEESFKSNIEEKDRVIADQRFIIDTLKNQVAALSSVNAGFLDPNTGEPKMNILDGDFEFEDLIRA